MRAASRAPVTLMVEIPADAGAAAGAAGDREACLRKFREWWSAAEMRGILDEISPHVTKMLGGHGTGGSSGGGGGGGGGGGAEDVTANADRLAEILYSSVGPHFLRNIDNSPPKRQRFVRHVLDAAIGGGDTTKDGLLGLQLPKSHLHVRSLDGIARVAATGRWCRLLAAELGLPQSTADKESVEKPPPTEIVEPHSPLNPLYDYQYSTGLLIRDMLEGRRADEAGRPVKRQLIAVPTGAGKTRMVVETLIGWLNDGKPSAHRQQSGSRFVLWIAQNWELCEQALSSFRSVFESSGRRGTTLRLHRFWGPGGALPSMKMGDLLDEKGVIVATIQSLDKVLKNDPDQLDSLARATSCIVVDEAHHSTARSYSDVLRRMHFNWDNRKKEISELGIILVGLTATPFRGTGSDEERAQLRRRYGGVHYPAIPDHGEGSNLRPHALVDCQQSAYAGDYVRILGEKSYDRDGFIRDRGYRWTIEKTRRFVDLYRNGGDGGGGPAEDARTFEGEKNIVQRFDEPGEYKVTLTVTDNEGDTGSAAAYLRIREAPGGAGGMPRAETHVQKALYHKLIKRRILCSVYHRILASDQIVLAGRDIEYMRKFGEFGKDTVKAIGQNPARNRRILEEMRDMRNSHGRRKILFFGCSVEHSRMIALLLNALYGIRAAYVDSQTDPDSRAAAIESFRSGGLEVLCNFGVLTAGFDAPNIDCVFVGRPVKSTLLYTQMIGRGMRGTKSGGTEDVVIIDIDDNFQLGAGGGGSGAGDEHLAEVGWKVYREYWKAWEPGADSGGDPVPARTCPSCGKEARGSAAIRLAFGADPQAGQNDERAGPRQDAAPQCAECAARRARQARQAPHHTSSMLDDEFGFLRDKVYGHAPTSHQFRARADPGAVDAADRLYGGYGGYLKSKGLSVRGDPDLADGLYDAYFSLHSQKKAPPTAADVDLDGRYTAGDYAECFGSYDRFREIAEEVIRRMSALDPGITGAYLFKDYRRMCADLGSEPHFEDVRRMSHVGVEYYLGLFGSMAGFRGAEECDRAAALGDLESDHDRLRGLLGVAPNARQMAAHAPESGGRLAALYPGLGEEEAHAAFLRDAGIR